jgi:hypothetical protein
MFANDSGGPYYYNWISTRYPMGNYKGTLTGRTPGIYEIESTGA